MNNIKGIAFVSDGNLKRIAVTFDIIEDDGTVTSSNTRINKIVTDSDAQEHISALEKFAQSIIDNI
jgi:hypothetical protein